MGGGINQRLTLPSKAGAIWYQMTPPRVRPWWPRAGPVGVSYPQSLSDIVRETPTAVVDEEVSNRHPSKAGGAGGTCKMKDTVGMQGKSDRMQIICYN